jgi:hypothetical protein
MTGVVLLWLSMAGVFAQAPDLSLDVRVFDGPTEVTTQTIVSVFRTGSRDNPQRMPMGPAGERSITLPAGQYDLQLVHQDEGRVLGVRWTTLRLLADYPGTHGRHLEVLNLRPGFGGLQIRQAGVRHTGRVDWTAVLRRPGGGEPAGEAHPGDGYLLFVVPPGVYDVEVRTAGGTTTWLRDAEVHEHQTYLKSW